MRESMHQGIKEKRFRDYAIRPQNPKWIESNTRIGELYHREKDIRSEFERDYNRILNSTAFSRLKHKTQVFYATTNDHVCTRIEHVNIVASISKTIARSLGLNVELVEAIAYGHDLGHSPFGHHGEKIIANIMEEEHLTEPFWHEKNSLRMVDYIETLPNYYGEHNNLNLTYAVRDGIVCHCGEVDENGLKPRNEFFDLQQIPKGKYFPYTYEGCVVKVSDKLAYIGRDIEDATRYNMFSKKEFATLKQIALTFMKQNVKLKQINPTSLISELVKDLCENSNPDDGLCFTKENFELLTQVKHFILENVCMNKRMKPFMEYANLVIRTVYNFLKDYYDGENTINRLKKDTRLYTEIIVDFRKWLIKYSNIDTDLRVIRKYHNKIVYDINNPADYQRAIIDFISCMTDRYIMRIHTELISF